MKNMFKSKKGFTLVELLAVIVILALLIVITANTVLPMMGNSEKSGMVTYAGRVINNAISQVQVDSLAETITTKYYKITDLMGQDDYIGCVKVVAKSDKSGYDYAIKMFSSSDNYFIYAATSGLTGTNGADVNAKGIIDTNGTISGIDLKSEVELTTMPTLNNVESNCATVWDSFTPTYKTS